MRVGREVEAEGKVEGSEVECKGRGKREGKKSEGQSEGEREGGKRRGVKGDVSEGMGNMMWDGRGGNRLTRNEGEMKMKFRGRKKVSLRRKERE